MVAPGGSSGTLLLAVDIGNTNIVVGLFAGSNLVDRWRMATDTRKTADEYAALLSTLLRLDGHAMAEIGDAVIASVVPGVEAVLVETVRRYLHRDPVIVRGSTDTGLAIQYSPVTAVGADRIANAVAALDLFGAPAIVVDFGTATTFDAISRDGVYVGGAIAPGLEISEDALISHAAQLSRVPRTAPASAIGTNTVSSLQSGIVLGYAGLVDGLVDRFRQELGEDAVAIATGGLGATIAPHSRTIQHVDPDLTLRGLYLLHERIRLAPLACSGQN